MSHEPERWMFWLGNEALKNCFGTSVNLAAAVEMTILICFLLKILQTGVFEPMFRRAAANAAGR